MSDAKRRTEVAIDEAMSRGFEVIIGNDYHILLDIDTSGQMAQYAERRGEAADIHGYSEIDRWRSINDHWHVLGILLRPLCAAHRIALQAALGSDPKREMLAVNLLVQWPNEEPCVLFKPTEEARRNYKPKQKGESK